MRLAFMGSPAFALPALAALQKAGHEIVAVYCQPPRPAGRGQEIRPCPVHSAATARGIDVRTPARLRNELGEQAAFAALALDAAVVVAYGLILPVTILKAPRRGCLNIHASLLPRWRGAAPIQAAILAGDAETGITIMQMDAGLDTGPMVMQASVPISPATTTGELHDKLAALGAGLIVAALAADLSPVAQPDEAATYAPKLRREDGRLDWMTHAVALDRRVRALNPWPGTFTLLAGQTLKVLAARPEPGEGPPGTLLDDALLVATGAGALRLLRVQAPGRAALDAESFVRGTSAAAGTRLG